MLQCIETDQLIISAHQQQQSATSSRSGRGGSSRGNSSDSIYNIQPISIPPCTPTPTTGADPRKGLSSTGVRTPLSSAGKGLTSSAATGVRTPLSRHRDSITLYTPSPRAATTSTGTALSVVHQQQQQQYSSKNNNQQQLVPLTTAPYSNSSSGSSSENKEVHHPPTSSTTTPAVAAKLSRLHISLRNTAVVEIDHTTTEVVPSPIANMRTSLKPKAEVY